LSLFLKLLIIIIDMVNSQVNEFHVSEDRNRPVYVCCE